MLIYMSIIEKIIITILAVNWYSEGANPPQFTPLLLFLRTTLDGNIFNSDKNSKNINYKKNLL